jgi:hypothetical protein
MCGLPHTGGGGPGAPGRWPHCELDGEVRRPPLALADRMARAYALGPPGDRMAQRWPGWSMACAEPGWLEARKVRMVEIPRDGGWVRCQGCLAGVRDGAVLTSPGTGRMVSGMALGLTGVRPGRRGSAHGSACLPVTSGLTVWVRCTSGLAGLVHQHLWAADVQEIAGVHRGDLGAAQSCLGRQRQHPFCAVSAIAIAVSHA